jgi:hypothetical protein
MVFLSFLCFFYFSAAQANSFVLFLTLTNFLTSWAGDFVSQAEVVQIKSRAICFRDYSLFARSEIHAEPRDN